MEMVRIIQCDATDCAYNQNSQCHAMAITVGNGMDHKCDTFTMGTAKGGFPDVIGGVGACKATSCKHNTSLECQAPGIKVGREGGIVDCLTFESR